MGEEERSSELATIRLCSMTALKAGWYLAWRTIAAWALASLLSGLLLVVVPMWGWAVSPTETALWWVGAAALAPLVPWVYVMQRVIRAWARVQYGQTPHGVLWWGVIWRSAFVWVPLAGIDRVIWSLADTRPVWLLVLVVLVIRVPLFIVSLQTLGWAMSQIVRKKLIAKEVLETPVGPGFHLQFREGRALFTEQTAEEFAEDLRHQGQEVQVRPVPAARMLRQVFARDLQWTPPGEPGTSSEDTSASGP